MYKLFIILLCLCGCAGSPYIPANYEKSVVSTNGFDIAVWQKKTDTISPVHIYIEGDGHAFNGRGMPTSDPSPKSTFLRDLAFSDTSPNVVYIARPCQFIMSPQCEQTYWTDGRFNRAVIDSMAAAIKQIAGKAPIILIGYSGGAMVSGLVIEHYPELNVKKWITVAGVLNHADWTEYFGDSSLSNSMNLEVLPNVAQVHYAGTKDNVVPPELTNKWTAGENMILVNEATHDDFGNLKLDFTY